MAFFLKKNKIKRAFSFCQHNNTHIYFLFWRHSNEIFFSLWLQEILYWFSGKAKSPRTDLDIMTCLLLWEAETIIVRSMEISHPDGWCQYLDECFQIPIKQLSIILWAGSGLPVFLGLRGNIWRPKGREYNYWAWQKSNNRRNTHRSHQNYKTQEFRVPSPPSPSGKRVLPLSYVFTFIFASQTIQAIHPDHSFLACGSPHLLLVCLKMISTALAGVARLVGVSSRTLKGWGLHSQSKHIHRFWVWSLIRLRAGGNWGIFLSHNIFFPPFSPLLPAFLSKINNKLEKDKHH